MFLPVLEAFTKRIRWPQVASHADELLERAGTVFKAGVGKTQELGQAAVMDDFADRNVSESIYQWATKSSGKFGRIADEFQSPDMVFGRSDAGKKLWQASVDDMLESGKFYDEHITKEFRALEKGVKKSRYDMVFDSLQQPELVAELSPIERRARDFFKGKYEFHLDDYLRRLGKDEAGYQLIIRTAERWKTLLPEEKAALDPLIREGAEFANRKIVDYVPHMFNRDEVIHHMKLQIAKFKGKLDSTQVPKDREIWAGKLKEYESKLNRLVGGDPLSWETLPSEFPFRYAMRRKGAEGYLKDPFKAYKSYVYHMGKKLFTEPTVRVMAEEFKNLPMEMKPYAKWYIRDYAGWGQTSPLDEAAGWIATMQYWRTLGLNVRSAIVNLTQQMNTWIDAGPIWSLKGYIRAFTKEGERLFKATGIDIEVPHGFYGDMSPSAGWMERVSRILGYLFQTAERGNRKHAFLTYLSRAEHKYGGITEQAIREAIDGVHKTQFLYGKVGMPKVLRTAGGRVLGQYSSFTLKQAEFMRKMWRENPVKFAIFAAMQFEGAKTLGDIMGLDLSNALGFGMTFGEAGEVLGSLTDGELEEAWALASAAMSKGTGVLPSGIGGPTVGTILGIARGVKDKKSIPLAVMEELSPTQWLRTEDAVRNVIEGIKRKQVMEGKVPVQKYVGPAGAREAQEVLFETDLGKALLEIGPKTTERQRLQSKWYRQTVMEQLDSKRKRIIADAILNGDSGKAEKLMRKYEIAPTREMLMEAAIRRAVPREYRKAFQVKEARELVREERRLRRKLEKGEEVE